jgi:hypothetical protein
MDALDRLLARAVAQPPLRVVAALMRVLLALAFLPSGLVKILGEPFTTLPMSDPVGFFFAGFFSAHGYYRFVGVLQWAAGALLLVPRTATLGSFLYLPIVVNIFAITVGIGSAFGGTRYITGAMLLGNLYLICWDWDRWRGILPSTAAPAGRHADLLPSLGLFAAAAAGFRAIVGLHLARLRHMPYGPWLQMLTAAAVVGVFALLTTYRRARSMRPSI